MKKATKLAINDLQKAWSPIEPIDCSFVKMEVHPQLVTSISSTEVVVISSFDIELENAQGVMTLVIPYSTLEPMKQKLSSGFERPLDRSVQTSWRSFLREQLLSTEVGIKVDLGVASISVGQLMGLKVGDVIPLEQGAAEEFDVSVETVKKYKAHHGIHHGNLAIQVTKIIAK